MVIINIEEYKRDNMIQRLITISVLAVAFLVLSSSAYAQYFPGDPFGATPTICSYDDQGYAVYCSDQDGYNYYYYGHGPNWGGEKEPQPGEHRKFENERGEHHKVSKHH